MIPLISTDFEAVAVISESIVFLPATISRTPSLLERYRRRAARVNTIL